MTLIVTNIFDFVYFLCIENFNLRQFRYPWVDLKNANCFLNKIKLIVDTNILKILLITIIIKDTDLSDGHVLSNQYL